MSGEELSQQLAAAPKDDGAQWTKEQALEWLANAEAADVELTAEMQVIEFWPDYGHGP